MSVFAPRRDALRRVRSIQNRRLSIPNEPDWFFLTSVSHQIAPQQFIRCFPAHKNPVRFAESRCGGSTEMASRRADARRAQLKGLSGAKQIKSHCSPPPKKTPPVGSFPAQHPKKQPKQTQKLITTPQYTPPGGFVFQNEPTEIPRFFPSLPIVPQSLNPTFPTPKRWVRFAETYIGPPLAFGKALVGTRCRASVPAPVFGSSPSGAGGPPVSFRRRVEQASRLYFLAAP